MIRRLWGRLVRWYRLNVRRDPELVCEASRDLGPYDYHDYPDSVEGYPDHFVLLMCRRCGKEFYI